MEIRILQEEELANASGLSRFVFDNCLRNRMEFVQTIPFVENYIAEVNLRKMCAEDALKVWGAFEQGQLIGVSALQADGMITMLYVLPQFSRRKYGSKLLFAMREYARDVLKLPQVFVNATPAWTASYFVKQGFFYRDKNVNMRQPFVSLFALSNQTELYKREKISGRTIALAIAGCIGFATLAGSLFMISYLF